MPKNNYPDLRRKFKVGDRVCTTYKYKKEKAHRACGNVEKVIKDALDIRWDTSRGRVSRRWDFGVFKGTGNYSPVTKVKKRRK